MKTLDTARNRNVLDSDSTIRRCLASWCLTIGYFAQFNVILNIVLVRIAVAEALLCPLATHIVLVREVERAGHHQHHDHVNLVPVSLVAGELVGGEDVAVARPVGRQRDLQHSRDPRQQENNTAEHAEVPEAQHVREVGEEEGVEGGAEHAVEDEAGHEQVPLGGVQHQQHGPNDAAADAEKTGGREALTVHQRTHRENGDHTCRHDK